ncbi:endonuclease [Streptomyces sp. 7-21]|nr:endonuclease [Streptomyces sp. 7-21]MBL1068733.1 endonuclease [Streptomyces sp. 7-21]
MARTAPARKAEATTRALLDRCGRTYAAQAGIRLRNTPAALYQLLVLAHLLSARIRADVAVAAARALFDAGMRTPERMAKATWQQRVDALGAGHYRRYDERTATQLGDAARLLLDRYGGDLRKLRGARDLRAALQEFPGIGPAGAEIFLREVQAVWPECAPHIDAKAREGAQRLGLPRSPKALSGLVAGDDVARLSAGLVRVALDRSLADEVKARAAG